MWLGMGQAWHRGEVETGGCESKRGGGESESGEQRARVCWMLCWRTWRSVVVAAGVATKRGHHRPAPPQEDDPDHEPSFEPSGCHLSP